MGAGILPKGSETLWKESGSALIHGCVLELFNSALKCHGPGWEFVKGKSTYGPQRRDERGGLSESSPGWAMQFPTGPSTHGNY